MALHPFIIKGCLLSAVLHSLLFLMTDVLHADYYRHWFYDKEVNSKQLKKWYGDSYHNKPRSYPPSHVPPPRYVPPPQYNHRNYSPPPKYVPPLPPRRSVDYNNQSPLRRPPPYRVRRHNSQHYSQHQGFGLLFPNLSADYRTRYSNIPDAVFQRLTLTMREASAEAERYSDSWVPAGYTFLGQFIDHDITFDTTSMLGMRIKAQDIKNARTSALDLDSLYGGGPEETPFLYNLPYLRVGKRLAGVGFRARFDFLRTTNSKRSGPQGGAATALIGDPRNDENFILAQLHSVFIAFHNRLVDILVERGFREHSYRYCKSRHCGTRELAKHIPRKRKTEIFEIARDHVIHYYHRIILEDYLPRIIGRRLLRHIMSNGRQFYYPNGFGHPKGGYREKLVVNPFIPIEFSAAAFRYGHSQVRQSYQLRRGVQQQVLTRRIRAFQPLRRELLIDWKYFFPIDRTPPHGFNFSHKIDRRIVSTLFQLGRSNVVSPQDVVSLPARNLLRGQTLSLPSGQAVASEILPVLYESNVLDNRGGSYRLSHIASWTQYLIPPDRHVRRILRHDQTPLWYYILQEAEFFGGLSRNEVGVRKDIGGRSNVSKRSGDYYQGVSFDRHYNARFKLAEGGHLLGPVGGTIVGEVLIGLLQHYMRKTSKGLKYKPFITADMYPSLAKPLSLTSIPDLKSGYKSAYMMRNLIIDSGLAGNPLQRRSHRGRRAARY